MVLEDTMQFLRDFGFFTLVLPFLLVFILVFGILEKVKILGDKRRINIMVALTIALLGIASSFLTTFITDFFPKVTISLVILFSFLMIIKLLNPDLDLDVWYMKLIVPVLFIALIIVQFKEFIGSSVSSILQNPLFWFIVGIIILIWFLIGSGKKSESKTSKESKPERSKPASKGSKQTSKGSRPTEADYKMEKVGRVKGEELKEGYEKGFS